MSEMLKLSPSGTYAHPLLYDEKGDPKEEISYEEATLYILRCAGILREGVSEDLLFKKHIGGFKYLLKQYTLDEVLYMAEICAEESLTLGSILDVDRFSRDATTRVHDKLSRLAWVRGDA